MSLVWWACFPDLVTKSNKQTSSRLSKVLNHFQSPNVVSFPSYSISVIPPDHCWGNGSAGSCCTSKNDTIEPPMLQSCSHLYTCAGTNAITLFSSQGANNQAKFPFPQTSCLFVVTESEWREKVYVSACRTQLGCRSVVFWLDFQSV